MGDQAMEEFGVIASYKNAHFMRCLTPLAFLGVLGFIWVYSMTEDGELIQFKWWIPLFAIAIAVWAFRDFAAASAISRVRVRLSNDEIELTGQRMAWSDISKVTFHDAIGHQAGAKITSKDGRVAEIPAAIESFAYIRGVIEAKAPPDALG